MLQKEAIEPGTLQLGLISKRNITWKIVKATIDKHCMEYMKKL